MPLPFSNDPAVSGTGAAAGGSLSATEKNEQAKSAFEAAKRAYDNELQSARSAYDELTDTVSQVGQSREYLINNPVAKFRDSVNLIKHLDLFDMTGANAAEKFDIGDFDAMMAYGASLRNTANQGAYDAKSFLSVALGPALAGAGAAAMLTSPPAVIADPVLLGAAFKADEEADKNLAEARAFETRCQAECEKLRIQAVKFNAMNTQFLNFRGLLDQIGRIFEYCADKSWEIISSHRDVIEAQDVRATSEIFSAEELLNIRTAMNLFSAVKTLCMMNLAEDANGEPEVTAEFDDEFIDNMNQVVDSHHDILLLAEAEDIDNALKEIARIKADFKEQYDSFRSIMSENDPETSPENFSKLIDTIMSRVDKD